MADDRTADQRAADDELTAAIEHVLRAHATDDSHELLLMEYVVVAASGGFDGDGDQVTALWLHPRDSGEVPPHRLLGMLEYASTRVRSGITAEERWT